MDFRHDGLRLPAGDPLLSLVIPLYNETSRIRRTLEVLRRWQPPFGSAEIIFVDDGSEDDTRSLLLDSLDDAMPFAVDLLGFDTNHGKGVAVRAGARAAKGRFVAFIDADLAVGLDDLARAVSLIETTGAGLVIGSRRHADSTVDRTTDPKRGASSAAFNALVRGLALSQHRDTQCGLKVMRAELVPLLFEEQLAGRFAFDVELLARAETNGVEVAVLPVRWTEQPGSSVRLVKDSAHMLADVLRLRLNRHMLAPSASGTAASAGLKSAVDTTGPSDATRTGAPRRAARRPIGWWLPPERRRAIGLLLLVLAGFTMRFAIAATTDNADGRTLAWGSAFLAHGQNPYKATIEHPESDPIPLGGIRSLSLAQGPLGVAAGAVPLWVGEKIGAIDLGDPPDGRSFGLGELVTYKLSYLLPELLILVAIFGLHRSGQSRRLAVGIWAFTPLAFFTWGQGMPDTWTVAVVLLGLVLMRRIATAVRVTQISRAYVFAIAWICVGALTTKLIPIVLLVPLTIGLARDPRLSTRRRVAVASSIPVALALGYLPYALNPYAAAHVFHRFEFDMLYNGRGLPTASALPEAPWGLMILAGLTIWLATRPTVFAANRPGAAELWTMASLLVVTTTSGIITHLMFWALAALIIMVGRTHAGATLAATGFAVATIWHLASYDWLSGVTATAADPSFVQGRPFTWLTLHIPAVHLWGSAAAALLVAAAAAGCVLAFRDRAVSRQAIPAISLGGVTAVLTLFVLGFTAVTAASMPDPSWDLGFGAYETGQVVAVPRGGAWVSEPFTTRSPVDTLAFRVDRSTQPSTDVIVAELVRNDAVLAAGEIAVWTAEPMSDRGQVVVRLNRRVDPSDAVLRIRRKVLDSEWRPTRLTNGAIVPVNSPILNLEGVVTSAGTVRTDVTAWDGRGDEMAAALLTMWLAPHRVLGILIGAALATLSAAPIVSRRNRPRVPVTAKLVTRREAHSTATDSDRSDGSGLPSLPEMGQTATVD